MWSLSRSNPFFDKTWFEINIKLKAFHQVMPLRCLQLSYGPSGALSSTDYLNHVSPYSPTFSHSGLIRNNVRLIIYRQLNFRPTHRYVIQSRHAYCPMGCVMAPESIHPSSTLSANSPYIIDRGGRRFCNRYINSITWPQHLLHLIVGQ